MIGFWSHHQVAPKRDMLFCGNANKKLRILFGIPLALHYLCHCIAKIGFGSFIFAVGKVCINFAKKS